MSPDNKFGLMLGLSIAELCCCCPIAGIIGIVFAVQANTAHNSGDYESYDAKAKAVKITLLIGLGVGLLMGILSLVINGATIAELMNQGY